EADLALPAVAVGRLRQRWHVAETRQRLLEGSQLLLEAQVLAAPGSVVVGGLTADASLDQRPQQAEDRRHAGAAADEDQVAVAALAEGEDTEWAGDVEPVADGQPGVQKVREQPVRIDPDHELELAGVPAGRVGH